jgi:hypothetical protein
MAEFRDRRIIDGVRAAQIDLILIRHCIKLARLEWGVNLPTNPVEGIRIPNGINVARGGSEKESMSFCRCCRAMPKPLYLGLY